MKRRAKKKGKEKRKKEEQKASFMDGKVKQRKREKEGEVLKHQYLNIGSLNLSDGWLKSRETLIN